MKYRTRMTLVFSALALFGIVCLGAFTLYTSQQALRETRTQDGTRMSMCLAKNIARDISQDNIFRVSETLTQFQEGWATIDQPQAVVVDPQERIYITTGHPSRDYISAPASELDPEYGDLLAGYGTGESVQVSSRAAEFFTMVPIQHDQENLGTLVTRFPLHSLQQRTETAAYLLLGYSTGLFAVLLTVLWLLGKRMVQPLVMLTSNMRRVGQGNLDVTCEMPDRKDEFAELGHGFEEMLKGLREKETLKSEIIKSERLAAIGQVSAALAHEINNPLGGMLNAIDTYRKHGHNPDVAHKTVDLIDRGLIQLRDTVQALLVNVRPEDRDLGSQDLTDIHTLVAPQARHKRIHMDWQCDLAQPSGVPASQTRQVVLNLVLNAIQVTPDEGKVSISCETSGTGVLLRVEDSGPGIPEDMKSKLFEPFVGESKGSGLGLWVSFQIVTGLGGEIYAEDAETGTRFVVRLPRRPDFVRMSSHAE